MKKLTTDEAAKAMIDGYIGIDSEGHEWKWESGGFRWKRGENFSWSNSYHPLTETEWTIKKEPIKYSNYVWLETEPKNNGSPGFILTHLFGAQGTAWNSTKTSVCNKRYKITIEEDPEQAEK